MERNHSQEPALLTEFRSRKKISNVKRDLAAKAIEDFLNWSSMIGRAYCGWLICQRAFMREHEKLMKLEMPGNRKSADLARRQLCDKWRLIDLPGPYLPLPPVASVCDSTLDPSAASPSVSWASTLIMPGINPVLPRDRMRDLIETLARRDDAPRYLQPWMKLVAIDNTARQELPRYARIYELHHHMRTLKLRYPLSLHRKQTQVIAALADYFSASTKSAISTAAIQADLRFMSRCLGEMWKTKYISYL
jgi:hypothetical protein